jgi:uncharacterized protein
MDLNTASNRVRAFGYFIIAFVYFYFAQMVAARAAAGLSSGDWSELVGRAILLFLLLAGYWVMGRAFEKQSRPIEAMGLAFRPGWQREFGLGAALGWGMLIACILPMVLARGFIVRLWTAPHQFVLLILDLLVVAIASLAEEVAYRGYPFQRLVEAIGPVWATLAASALFALLHLFNPGSDRASLTITMFAGWLLCAAYLRTRALWFAWGWHFAWNASMGLLFGLPISGITRFSPVIQTNTIGAPWLTGGDYGPEASLVTGIVMLVGLVLVFRITRSYAYMYAQPVIVAGGLPVDLDAMNRVLAPHHPAPAGEKLVQIGTVPDPDPIPRAGESAEEKPSFSPPSSASLPERESFTPPGPSPDSREK